MPPMADQTPRKDEKAEEPALPPYIIEGARSSRSKCKTCRKKIDKGVLRIGVMIQGPFGEGFLWHHLKCAAKRQLDRVEEAYELEAWTEAKDPPDDVPPIEELRLLQEAAEAKKKAQKELPHTEPAPSGRARCKRCEETIEKDSMRVVLAREVSFGSQVRTTPINVHPACVAEELQADDCVSEVDGFADTVRHNSTRVDEARVEEALRAVGL